LKKILKKKREGDLSKLIKPAVRVMHNIRFNIFLNFLFIYTTTKIDAHKIKNLPNVEAFVRDHDNPTEIKSKQIINSNSKSTNRTILWNICNDIRKPLKIKIKHMSEKLLISENEFFDTHAYVKIWLHSFIKWI